MLVAILAGVVVAAVTAYVRIAIDRRQAHEILETARAEAKLAVRSSQMEAAAIRRAAETDGREQVLEMRARADEELSAAVEALARREERQAGASAGVDEEHKRLKQARAELDERQSAVQSQKDRAGGLRRQVEQLESEARGQLEQLCGVTADSLREELGQRWLDDARADAAQLLRSVEHGPGDTEASRGAERTIQTAVGRYQNHFLTERGISTIQLQTGVAELIQSNGNLVLDELQDVANVQIHLAETGASVRLEGLDGVGREVARRALSRLNKKPQSHADATRDPRTWAQTIREQLDREIQGLGRKAFTVLKLPTADKEIVTLVGRLNYRTSYTQNQWLHAVEASFLAGMMAAEMGLDIRLARRATLLHDIGKALTHEIDGSHAVIGADIARRLGEDEVVANAIGAHHADEPPNSVYAYLVAAADAMSGARPGARREHTDGYSTRLEDLERIGSRHRGVDRCFAVHGGRELRVYVREDSLSDLEAVELSSEIAEQISEEMTFPGQIKVTVIRSSEAVSVAS